VIAQNDTPDAGPADAGVRAHEATSSVPFAPGAPRRVCLQPRVGDRSVGALMVSVDGAEPCPFTTCGCSTVDTGVVHRFRLTGDCCTTQTVSRRIAPGPGDLEIPVALHYQATLYVEVRGGNADVLVEGVRLGRSRQLLAVDLGTGSGSAFMEVTVQEPGFRRHQQTVQFRQGQRAQLSVSLEPEGPTAENQSSTGSEAD
jgi:hypothetical protein